MWKSAYVGVYQLLILPNKTLYEYGLFYNKPRVKLTEHTQMTAFEFHLSHLFHLFIQGLPVCKKKFTQKTDTAYWSLKC